MRLEKYGIVLEQLQQQDLEMVRRWRNADHVRHNMQYRDIISAQMQAQWFSRLDKKKNLYFIILKNKTKLGVVNLKDILFEKLEAEAGIFIGETEFLNSIVPVAATVLIMEYAFETLGLKKLKAKIGATNHKAIRFNQDIGYTKNPLQRDAEFYYYTVSAGNFYEATKSKRETLRKL